MPKSDGVVTRICNASRYLAAAGDEVYIITGQASPPAVSYAQVFSTTSIKLPYLQHRTISLLTRSLLNKISEIKLEPNDIVEIPFNNPDS